MHRSVELSVQHETVKPGRYRFLSGHLVTDRQIPYVQRMQNQFGLFHLFFGNRYLRLPRRRLPVRITLIPLVQGDIDVFEFEDFEIDLVAKERPGIDDHVQATERGQLRCIRVLGVVDDDPCRRHDGLAPHLEIELVDAEFEPGCVEDALFDVGFVLPEIGEHQVKEQADRGNERKRHYRGEDFDEKAHDEVDLLFDE